MTSQHSPEAGSFSYFPDPRERAMIAECGYRVADYLKHEDIGTLILVDRAARNLYIPVREAYKQQNPGEQLPGVYFLNPSGFISPETHDKISYSTRALVPIMESAETLRDAELSLKRHPFSVARAVASGSWQRRFDTFTDKRTKIAEKFTPLFERAVKRDRAFNGSALVLDACWHTGGSIKGIARTLKDIGVIDVRTGVVNDIRSETHDRADFVVFEDHEIQDDCKPFGTQRGLTKGTGENLTSGLNSERGLSDKERLARAELHQIMQSGQELRSSFADDLAPIDQMPRLLRQLLGKHFVKLYRGAAGSEMPEVVQTFRNGAYLEVEFIIPKEPPTDV